MVGVDTTFLVDLFRNESNAIKLLEELSKSKERIVTTVINMAELYKEAFLHSNTEKKLEGIEDIMEKYMQT